MSVFTDMARVSLTINNPLSSKSGALKELFEHVADIDVAIYKTSSYRKTTNVRYQESTHDGITFYKGFEEGKQYRLQSGVTLYEIMDFNTTGRSTTLILKVITYG